MKEITLFIKKTVIFNSIKNVAKNRENNTYVWYLFNINIDFNQSNICEIKFKVLSKQNMKKVRKNKASHY
jgi:hypothetical protein